MDLPQTHSAVKRLSSVKRDIPSQIQVTLSHVGRTGSGREQAVPNAKVLILILESNFMRSSNINNIRLRLMDRGRIGTTDIRASCGICSYIKFKSSHFELHAHHFKIEHQKTERKRKVFSLCQINKRTQKPRNGIKVAKARRTLNYLHYLLTSN